MKKDYKVHDIVLFQAYPENQPVEGRIKRIGTKKELGMMQLDPNDDRILYELETVGEGRNFVFTVTTGEWIKPLVYNKDK